MDNYLKIIKESKDINELGNIIESMIFKRASAEQSLCPLKDYLINEYNDIISESKYRIERISFDKARGDFHILFDKIYDEGFEDISIKIDFIEDGDCLYQFYCIRIKSKDNHLIQGYLNKEGIKFMAANDYLFIW